MAALTTLTIRMDSDELSGTLLAPLGLAVGLAFGATIGWGFINGFDSPKGNDVAGAGAAILFYGMAVVGFVVTLITMFVRKLVLHRSPMDRLALRCGASLLGGLVIGLTSKGNGGLGLFLLMVVGVPIALASPWPGGDD